MRQALSAAALLAMLAFPAAAQSPPASSAKLYHEACPGFEPGMTFNCYHSYDEVAAFLQEAARRYPGLARLDSYGKSYAGRDLWVLTVTDFSAGDPATKPALWVDGGIDADEVVATEAALGLVHRLLTSMDPQVEALRRTRTFYIAPLVIPDVSELHHTTPQRPRDTTLRPWDDDGDGLLDEDGPEDLDGDGQALQMRREDPSGGLVKDSADARLMRPRRPGDTGPFYRVYPEGTDDDEDGEYGEDPVGGIDPNRNYPGNWSIDQGGAGPYPGSESELRALLDFALAHPNIAASQHFHSSGGVILRPPSVPHVKLPPADEQLYLALARRGLELTGYDLATTVYDWNWPRGSRNTRPTQVWRDREGKITGAPGYFGGDFSAPLLGETPPGESAYPAYGGSIDGMYLLFGVLAFANEIYQMGVDEDGDGVIEPIEQLAYNDRVLKGGAFQDWRPFDHPQLGRVRDRGVAQVRPQQSPAAGPAARGRAQRGLRADAGRPHAPAAGGRPRGGRAGRGCIPGARHGAQPRAPAYGARHPGAAGHRRSRPGFSRAGRGGAAALLGGAPGNWHPVRLPGAAGGMARPCHSGWHGVRPGGPSQGGYRGGYGAAGAVDARPGRCRVAAGAAINRSSATPATVRSARASSRRSSASCSLRRRFRSRSEANSALFGFIDGWYHPHRRPSP